MTARRPTVLFGSVARKKVKYLMAARRALTGGRSAPESGALMRIVSINDVYELHALPHLKTLINEQKPDLVTLCGDFLSPSILSGMDQGASMVATLNRLPVTHCCFGNHEADLQLEDIAIRASEFRAKWLNSNLPEFLPVYTSTARKLGGPLGFRPQMPPWDVVSVSGPRDSFRVGLLGLLTSERGIFRTDKMRGLQIQPVIPSAERWAARLRSELGVSHVIALTHQSVAADEALARSGCVDLILGGHEHEVMELRPEGGCPIIKAGSDAKTAAVVQLWLGANRAMDVRVTFEEVAQHSADVELQVEVDSHHAVLRALESEPMCALDDSPVLKASGTTLSSKRTRFEQTTVGALITSSIRDFLGAQVAMINGGTIKGDATYESGTLSYLQLKQELPFPTKMIVVSMPGSTLRDAICASRSGPPEEEKRSYLQLDDGVEVEEDTTGGPDGHDRPSAAGKEGGVPGSEQQYAARIRIGGRPLNLKQSYAVALPRNLIKGAFKIQPLIDFGKAHAAELPTEDSFIPALNVVVMSQAKRMWRRLGSFEALDLDGDGEISEHEIRVGLRAALGIDPSPFLVQNVLRALDKDNSGRISREEFKAIQPPAWMHTWGQSNARGGATRSVNRESSPEYSG